MRPRIFDRWFIGIPATALVASLCASCGSAAADEDHDEEEEGTICERRWDGVGLSIYCWPSLPNVRVVIPDDQTEAPGGSYPTPSWTSPHFDLFLVERQPKELSLRFAGPDEEEDEE
jgi:hypothetical protein